MNLSLYIKRAFLYIIKGQPKKIIKANITCTSPSKRLLNKKVVITGGGRGLGYSIAKKCSEEGAEVIIVGRNESTLINASQELSCHYLVYDVTDIDGISNFFDKCESIFGKGVDCLINNAGISLHEGNIFNVTSDTYDKQFLTNLKAPYFLSKEFITRYDNNKQTTGSILFITSERGLYCDDMPYGLIKAAINSFTEGLGRRVIDKGIRVNAIAPGVTVSDMTGYKKDGNLYRSSACGNRVYLAEEVAEITVFLLSDVSGCINSHIIPCNRGNHLRCDW